MSTGREQAFELWLRFEHTASAREISQSRPSNPLFLNYCLFPTGIEVRRAGTAHLGAGPVHESPAGAATHQALVAVKLTARRFNSADHARVTVGVCDIFLPAPTLPDEDHQA
jgi:hypothetical protein